jgi:two-component system, chemotaxis family, CheB/CheR fusion protein
LSRTARRTTDCAPGWPAATGEEAWSVAIALFEAKQASEGTFLVEIFATDASKAVLSRAREGIYPAASVQHLSPERRVRWFDRREDTLSVKPELRGAMIFAPQNLAQDPPFSRAESVGDTDNLFETVDKSGRLFRRLGPTRHDLVDLPVMRPARSGGSRPSAWRLPQRATERALQALVDRHAPPALLVGPGFEVLWYHGATERFLNPQAGAPTHNLLALARGGLAPHLRRVVEAARRSRSRWRACAYRSPRGRFRSRSRSHLPGATPTERFS